MATLESILRAKDMQFNKRTHFNPLGEPTSTALLRAPTVRIETHKSEVLSCEFHPSGKYILSSNSQGEIHVCDVEGTQTKMSVMKGHSGAVMETHFSRDGSKIYSCSTDETLGIWDTYSGIRKRKLEGHTKSINCVQGSRMGSPLLCSGSDDGTVRIWDPRDRKCVTTLEDGVKVTATCFSKLDDYVFCGSIDNEIKIWDIRRQAILSYLRGHTNQVTGIALSPCGGVLLSHSMDNTLRFWDVRPFVTSEYAILEYPSNQQGVHRLLRCAWSSDGKMVSAGTSESHIFVWDSCNGVILKRLPVHETNVNDVAFHPTELILASASDDNYLVLYQIDKEILE